MTRTVPGSNRTCNVTYEVKLRADRDPDGEQAINEIHVFNDVDEAHDFMTANDGSMIVKRVAYHWDHGDRFRGDWMPIGGLE